MNITKKITLNLFVLTILLVGFSIRSTHIYADSCDDIAQSYQPQINQITNNITNELKLRGIDINSSEGQQQLQTALQPVEAQMNNQVSTCKLQTTRTNDGLTNNQVVTPNNSIQKNDVVYTVTGSISQPTTVPQITQVVVIATLTPTIMTYRSYKPAYTPYYSPTLTLTPTATPSATLTPTKKPKMKTIQQTHNPLQDIEIFFQNIFHFVFKKH